MELGDLYSDSCFEEGLLKSLEEDAFFPDHSLDLSNTTSENFLYSDELLTSEMRDTSIKYFFDEYNFDFLEWKNPFDDLHQDTNTLINNKEIKEEGDYSNVNKLKAIHSSLITEEAVVNDSFNVSANSPTPTTPIQDPELWNTLVASDVHSLLEQFEATSNEKLLEQHQIKLVSRTCDVSSLNKNISAENIQDKTSLTSHILDHQYCSTPGEKKIIPNDYYNKIPEYLQGLKGLNDSESLNDFDTKFKAEISDQGADKILADKAPLANDEIQHEEENNKYSKIPPYLTDISQRSQTETLLPSENSRDNPKFANKCIRKNCEGEKNFRRNFDSEKSIKLKEFKNNAEETSSSIYSWDQKHYNPHEVSSRPVSYHSQDKSYSVRKNQKLFNCSSSNTSKRSYLHRHNVEEYKRMPSKVYPSKRLSMPKLWTVKDDKLNQVEDRRIIYVGNVSEGTTKADLRKRFGKFGTIDDVSVHFREHGDNYGFVTFSCKKAAFTAIEHGNDDPTLPKYDLCFGGRRHFCRSSYADLDAISNSAMTQLKQQPQKDLDFDSLLNAAKAKILKR